MAQMTGAMLRDKDGSAFSVKKYGIAIAVIAITAIFSMFMLYKSYVLEGARSEVHIALLFTTIAILLAALLFWIFNKKMGNDFDVSNAGFIIASLVSLFVLWFFLGYVKGDQDCARIVNDEEIATKDKSVWANVLTRKVCSVVNLERNTKFQLEYPDGALIVAHVHIDQTYADNPAGLAFVRDLLLKRKNDAGVLKTLSDEQAVVFMFIANEYGAMDLSSGSKLPEIEKLFNKKLQEEKRYKEVRYGKTTFKKIELVSQ